MTTTDPMAVSESVLELVGSRAEAIVGTTVGTSALTRFATSMIHQNVAEDVSSVFVKLVVDGRAASASTTKTDRDSLATVVERVLEAATLRPPDPDWPGLASPEAVADVEHWDDATADADPAARAEVVRAFVQAGEGLEAAGFCATSGTRYALATSSGVRRDGRWSWATINGIHRTGSSDASATQTGVRLADLDGAAAGIDAAAKARAGAEAIDVEPGTYEVVLGPSCLANMLQFLAMYGFNGKPFLEGTSFVHIGEAQLDSTVSIWDDATDPRTLGLLFDHDGTPKRRHDLVREGVSVNVVHDRRTARRAGAASTGHGVGQEAGAYPSNLFFGGGAPGTSQADLVAGVERGLLVHDFWYTRILDPKTQVVTGLTRNGVFLIEGGQVGPAVKNLRFTQSFVAALGPGKVRAIGDDGKIIRSDASGTMHVPSVHLGAWSFTGGAKG